MEKVGYTSSSSQKEFLVFLVFFVVIKVFTRPSRLESVSIPELQD